MASKKDEAKVKFTADTQEFNEEIKKSEQQMKEYRSELRLNSEMMKTAGESAELLQEKQNILTKEYDASEAKIQALSGKLEAAARIWGETSEEASKYRIQLNNARVAQEKIQQELQKTADQTKDFENKIAQAAQEVEGFDQETGQASKETEGFNKILDDSADSAKNAGDGYTVMKGALADLAADGIGKAAGALQDFIEDSETAASSFAAQTGASKAEMVSFNDEIEKLYKSGYGESMNDVGDAMAYVKQVMGDMEPEVISEISENAIVLNDVFDMDVKESIRAVDALMTTMGLDADEAFDYIAKGAQNGLDYSGELADNLAEYAPLWDQAGFSAEEMFTILQNGADTGAYNLDKINDFVKEFSISLSDGRIEENIESFSDETQQLFKEWKAGKKTSKDVFNSVIKDLKNAETQQDALTTASTIWSSLGEDNAMAIITSLTNVNDTYKDVYGTMETIKDVKYDNVVEQYKILGRTVATDLVAPLAEKALPALQEFANFAIENLDAIIPLAEGAGIAFGSIFLIDKAMEFAGALSSISNPLTLGIEAVALLTGAMVAGEAARRQMIEDTWGLTEEQKKLNEEIDASYAEYEAMIAKRDESVAGVQAEFDYLQQLRTELSGLVDENGRVKEGYQDRVNFILNELSQATGIEIQNNDGVIENYQELAGQLDTVIEKKRAEAMLAVYDESYATAIKEQASAYEAYNNALESNEEAHKKLTAAQEQSTKAREELSEAEKILGANTEIYQRNLAAALEAEDAAQKAYDETAQALKDAETEYVGYNATIENYEGLSAAIISSDADAIEDALTKTTHNFITAEQGTRESLERQVEEYEKQYKSMQEAVEKGGQGVTEESVESAKEMYEAALKELEKFGPEASDGMDEDMQQVVKTMQSYEGKMMDTGDMLSTSGMEAFLSHYKEWNNAGKTSISEADSGMKSKKSQVDATSQAITKGALAIFNGVDFTPAGKDWINDTAAGEASRKSVTDSTSKNIADSSNNQLGSADTQATGSNKVLEYNSGLLSQQGNVNSSASAISQSMDNNLGSADTYGTGNSEGMGLYSGLLGTQGTINSGAYAMAQSLDGNLRSANTWASGDSKGSDFYYGFTGWQGKANSGGVAVAGSAKSGLESVSAYGVGSDFTQGFANGITSGQMVAYRAAKGAAQMANAGLRAGTDSHSPSRIAKSIGFDYDEGFGIGIEENADIAYDASEGLGEMATQGLKDGLAYADTLKDAQNMVKDIQSFPGTYDNISVQYDGFFNMRQIEDMLAKYSKKTYSFTINRRELIRALEG